jgi:hypothetical protein
MVAAAKKNQEPLKGSFGRPLSRLQTTSLTEEEFRGLQRIAGFSSKSAALRRLLGPTVLEYLARVGRGEITLERMASGN